MLQQDILRLTHAWASKGHKANRARQRRMMMTFADYVTSRGTRSIDQVGHRSAISYWKHMRSLGRSHATQMDHWRALRELWMLAGIAGAPPEPRVTS